MLGKYVDRTSHSIGQDPKKRKKSDLNLKVGDTIKFHAGKEGMIEAEIVKLNKASVRVVGKGKFKRRQWRLPKEMLVVY